MSSGCQVVANQVPLYHLDATQTNPLPLRPKCGSILPMEGHFTNYLPFCHWSATWYFSVPLDCHCAVTQSKLYKKSTCATQPIQCHWTPILLALSQYIVQLQSSGSQVTFKWESSGSQVVVKWESSGHQVAVKW